MAKTGFKTYKVTGFTRDGFRVVGYIYRTLDDSGNYSFVLTKINNVPLFISKDFGCIHNILDKYLGNFDYFQIEGVENNA